MPTTHHATSRRVNGAAVNPGIAGGAAYALACFTMANHDLSATGAAWEEGDGDDALWGTGTNLAVGRGYHAFAQWELA